MAGFAATASSADAASARISPCEPKASQLIAVDTQAAVFRGIEGGPYGGLRYFGCVLGSRRRYVVGGPGVGSSAVAGGTRLFTLGGTFLANERTTSLEPTGGGPGRNEWLVLVRDLRTGRIVRKLPTGFANPPIRRSVGIGPATQIVVDPDGAVAWIAEDRVALAERAAEGRATPEEHPTYEVHVADASGSRVLASGPDIAPRSLALAGSTVYWTQGGAAASAGLS